MPSKEELLRDADLKKMLAGIVRGGVLLERGRPSNKVRNKVTGRVLPCCHGPCDNEGDVRIEVQVPHNQPRWRDPITGKQEMLVYIFCSDLCKRAFLKGSMYEDRA